MNDSPKAIEKIARILRAPREVIEHVEEHLSGVTGRKYAFRDLVDQNEAEMLEAMSALTLTPGANAQDIYDALLSKIEADDLALYEMFRKPDYSKPEAYKTVLGFARDVSGVGDGFFMKHEKAKELIKNQPPKEIMKALGYTDVDELLAKEDILDVYSALRFLEGPEWLNTVFFKQYEALRSSDFEIRPIELRVISPKWVDAAKRFMEKKHHNVSHLKELGIIFIIPWTLGHAGETMRMFSLLLHYMHEVEFYSKLFEKFTSAPKTFTFQFVSALRGDILEARPEDERTWLIVQRYLAKDDENDWRLFCPHVNPEALHWQKAEENLVHMGSRLGVPGLGFWHGLGWVGDYYATEAGIDVLVSFDLVDAAMSLVKEKERTKYLYHHQEALWNKIFASYFDQYTLEQMVFDNWESHVLRINARV